MSDLSAAIAAALQNDSTISPLITGVIPGRNFTLQDSMLATSPYSCISVLDLLLIDAPYLGTRTHGERMTHGQIEVRCISKSSEAAAKELAEAAKTFLWSSRSFQWNAAAIQNPIIGIRQNSTTDDALTTWDEILTCDY